MPTAIVKELETVKNNLGMVLRNRLSYPKKMADIAESRILTTEEVAKMIECMDECIRFTEAELSILLWKLEGKEKKDLDTTTT